MMQSKIVFAFLGTWCYISATQLQSNDRIVKAWFMDDSPLDPQGPHQLDPPQPCSWEYLNKFGVEYFQLNPKDFEDKLSKIKEMKGYNYTDYVECRPDDLQNGCKPKAFYQEHLHNDDEARFIVNGSGYFDVRDPEDRWIRIHCKAGDLLVVPAGIYHRFTLDKKNYVRAMRLFVGNPVWTKFNRSNGEHPAHNKYRAKFSLRSDKEHSSEAKSQHH